MKHYRAEKNCLNCGYEVDQKYCSNCGQPNVELREPFWHFIGHSISHYFHFDSKFFHTLRPLLTEPGRLTLEYLAGKRMTYLHPVSMYIFVSIVYFLVVPPLSQSRDEDDEPVRNETAMVADSAASTGDEIRREMGVNDDGSILSKGFNALDREIQTEHFRKLSTAQQKAFLDSIEKDPASKSDSLRNHITRLQRIYTIGQDSTYESYLKRQNSLPADKQDNWLEKKLKKREIVIEQRTNENWSIKKEVQKYNPKLYFLLMPLFAFFLMLNFRKNRKYYIEHLIFTIHFFTAFFIFQIFVKPLDHYIFNNDSNLFALAQFLVILWYIYNALKVFYQRKKWTTIRKIIT
ncbi:MAG TPA: DUF3667 domain-containing protein, partial [Sphingobacteriaceae bacterium]